MFPSHFSITLNITSSPEIERFLISIERYLDRQDVHYKFVDRREHYDQAPDDDRDQSEMNHEHTGPQCDSTRDGYRCKRSAGHESNHQSFADPPGIEVEWPREGTGSPAKQCLSIHTFGGQRCGLERGHNHTHISSGDPPYIEWTEEDANARCHSTFNAYRCELNIGHPGIHLQDQGELSERQWTSKDADEENQPAPIMTEGRGGTRCESTTTGLGSAVLRCRYTEGHPGDHRGSNGKTWGLFGLESQDGLCNSRYAGKRCCLNVGHHIRFPKHVFRDGRHSHQWTDEEADMIIGVDPSAGDDQSVTASWTVDPNAEVEIVDPPAMCPAELNGLPCSEYFGHPTRFHCHHESLVMWQSGDEGKAVPAAEAGRAKVGNSLDCLATHTMLVDDLPATRICHRVRGHDSDHWNKGHEDLNPLGWVKSTKIPTPKPKKSLRCQTRHPKRGHIQCSLNTGHESDHLNTATNDGWRKKEGTS